MLKGTLISFNPLINPRSGIEPILFLLLIQCSFLYSIVSVSVQEFIYCFRYHFQKAQYCFETKMNKQRVRVGWHWVYIHITADEWKHQDIRQTEVSWNVIDISWKYIVNVISVYTTIIKLCEIYYFIFLETDKIVRNAQTPVVIY